MRIQNILVIGSGAMGSQIGMVCALAGYQTTIQDISADALEAAFSQLVSRMSRDVEKGRRTRAEADEALGRLTFTTKLPEAAAKADLVIEAATEKLEIKQEVFRTLDAHAPAHAILTTNSSTYGSSKVAEVTGRPRQVCNLHFFNPALVMTCVEVVRHEKTSDETIRSVVKLVQDLGKSPVVLNREIPGFVANRLMGAIRDEALDLHSRGIASVEDIDTAARTALGHPMGPFELMDLVGLDVSFLIRKATHAETGRQEDLPHPMLEELYEQGKYGKKTGEGWYRYNEDGTKAGPAATDSTLA